MIGIFPWIAPSDITFALVYTRAKVANHWVTRKDDMFKVSTIVFSLSLGMMTKYSRSDWERIVDAGVSSQLEVDRVEGNQTQRSQGGRKEGYQTGRFYSSTHRSGKRCDTDLARE
jgi:hypothetical protein